MAKTSAIQKKKQDDEAPIKTFLSHVNESMLQKKNCNVCKSKFKQAAEDEYEKRHNFRAVHKLLMAKGEDFSYRSVRNHLIRHYLGEDKLEALKHYGEDISNWVDRSIDLRDSLTERKAILYREMVTIAAISDSQSLDERRRSADAIKKLSDSIAAIEDKIADMDRQQEPVDIMIEKLREIISTKMETVKSVETRAVLIDVLEQLSTQVADLLVEDK